MIKTSYIFSQVQRKSFSSDTPFGGKVSLKISPEPFKAIDVSALGVGKFTFAMVYQTMHVPIGRNPSLPSPGIGVNNGTTLHPLIDQGQEGCSLNTRNQLGPHIAITAQDTQNRLLTCSPAPLSSLQSLHFSLILPLASQIGLINFHRTLKYPRNILQHTFSDDIQCPQHSPSLKSCLRGYLITAQSQHEIPQYHSPLNTRRSQRQRAGNPFISTLSTLEFSPSYLPLLVIITLWTFVVFHATISMLLLANMVLYQNIIYCRGERVKTKEGCK